MWLRWQVDFWMATRLSRVMLVAIYTVALGAVLTVPYCAVSSRISDASPIICRSAGLLTAAVIVRLQWRRAHRLQSTAQHDVP